MTPGLYPFEDAEMQRGQVPALHVGVNHKMQYHSAMHIRLMHHNHAPPATTHFVSAQTYTHFTQAAVLKCHCGEQFVMLLNKPLSGPAYSQPLHTGVHRFACTCYGDHKSSGLTPLAGTTDQTAILTLKRSQISSKHVHTHAPFEKRDPTWSEHPRLLLRQLPAARCSHLCSLLFCATHQHQCTGRQLGNDCAQAAAVTAATEAVYELRSGSKRQADLVPDHFCGDFLYLHVLFITNNAISVQILCTNKAKAQQLQFEQKVEGVSRCRSNAPLATQELPALLHR